MKRGYSLMSVLAALIILMAVLIPLLSLQGRIFERAYNHEEEAALRIVETDMEKLGALSSIRTRVLSQTGFRVEREVRRLEPYLLKVTYEIKNNAGQVKHSMVRYVYMTQ